MTANEEADRLLALLDVDLKSLRAGDGEAALLAVKEAHESALRLPQKQKIIPLPDLTKDSA